ncbi:hypothetical protein Ddye_027713 [Dipteronia dyeriana]|uniref:Kinesin motor domain-containing protein n=1 Tax=Dipteronia dyeriana TaxID=168575 RepID=A0AAD9WRP8_9ROSI|nr:hypothetical protein Ddye_027713 [Dipteronia dyeriana]
MKSNATSIRNLLSKSLSSKSRSSLSNSFKVRKSNNENDPPLHPNISRFSPALSLSKSLTLDSQVAGSNGQCEVPQTQEPPPVKSQRESTGSDQTCEVSQVSDPPVKVVVRIRPVNDHERDVNRTVRKVSSDSLSVGDRKLTFDSVFDSNSNQEDIFQSVGVPLVENALAGYNATVLSYGQTGSGKTYTMWGPPSAMVEDPSPRSNQGIVPRIFQKLFSEIQREQENSDGKQINYQCRCSFLEIYNEQIGDLLDPTQRNLEIKDDPKNGLYVENLTEEYVTSYEDVTLILIKGLSSRKVGATSINSKSSRSHIVFTFIVESWCKEASSKSFSSSRMSRISLVDLAGADRNKLDDVGRQGVKEGKYVKKSLSQLGYLVNSLAEATQIGKSEDALYRSSRVTHLLRESLGGNTKLTVICNVSPDNKNIGEILSTLRFGQRAKFIRNDPVINEITEDDVNGLSDQIRQLKEELIRAKSDACNSVRSRNGYSKGRNVRDSLNQLRVSLNRSLILPRIDNDLEEEVNVDEEDVKELRQQLDKLHNSDEESSRDPTDNRDPDYFSSAEESFDADLMSEDEINCQEVSALEEINLEITEKELSHKENITLSDDLSVDDHNTSRSINSAFRSSISISSCSQSSILQDPPLSESPKIGNIRKSMAISSSFLASQNNVTESSKSDDALRQSLKQSENIRSSLQSSKVFPGPAESLAASLQRGLQIIDYHQRNSASSRSSVAFSFEHLTLKPCPEVDEPNASVQTSDGPSSLCASCRQKIDNNSNEEVQDGLKTLMVAGSDSTELVKRVKELENVCEEQAAKIEQLNRLIEQHKQESGETLLLKNEIVPFEEASQGDDHSMKDEKCEIKEIQEMLDHQSGNTSFDVNEKEALLQEIESLKSKLQSYTDASVYKSIDASVFKSTENLRSSLLSRSMQWRKSIDSRPNTAEELERERERWTEMESEWICLTDELRVDIESSRRHAEKVEMELRSEKKCTEELDDALSRAMLGHARMVEHYADLQDKYNDLVGRHRALMEGIAELKRAAAKAGAKGHGSRFSKSLAAELSALRVEKEREREFLKKENKSLKIQLRDTAEAVHAAGELLVRLREAEQSASVAEENFSCVQQDNEKLKKQIEKIKRKHKMEMVTMKRYLAESRLPESALQPLYHEDHDDSDIVHSSNAIPDDDQAWRAEFGAIYQEHF